MSHLTTKGFRGDFSRTTASAVRQSPSLSLGSLGRRSGASVQMSSDAIVAGCFGLQWLSIGCEQRESEFKANSDYPPVRNLKCFKRFLRHFRIWSSDAPIVPSHFDCQLPQLFTQFELWKEFSQSFYKISGLQVLAIATLQSASLEEVLLMVKLLEMKAFALGSCTNEQFK